MCSGSWRCSRGFLAAWLPARRVRSPGVGLRSGLPLSSLQPSRPVRRPTRTGRPRRAAGVTHGALTMHRSTVRRGAYTDEDQDEHRNSPKSPAAPAAPPDGDITLRIKCSDSRGRFYSRTPRRYGGYRLSGIACSRTSRPSLSPSASRARAARPFPLHQSARHPGTRSRRPDTPPPIEEVVRHTRTRLSAHQTQSVST